MSVHATAWHGCDQSPHDTSPRTTIPERRTHPTIQAGLRRDGTDPQAPTARRGGPFLLDTPRARLRMVKSIFYFRTRKLLDLAGAGRRRLSHCSGVRGLKGIEYQHFLMLRGVSAGWRNAWISSQPRRLS